MFILRAFLTFEAHEFWFASPPPNSVIFARHETEGVNETKYSRMDQVKFLKAVFHKFYLVRSWIICG